MRRRHSVGIGALAGALVYAAACIHHATLSGPTVADYSEPLGALNPDVTQETIAHTICIHGWTARIRPTASYTDSLKLKQMADRHLPGKPEDYEEDHLVALELGGAPRDATNLWPEPWHRDVDGHDEGAHEKDRLENRLHEEVCAGRLTLAAAQDAIRRDWRKAYLARFGAFPTTVGGR